MTNADQTPILLERSPWPALGIQHYSTIKDGDWGYLSIYDGAPPEFEEIQPKTHEIIARWGEAMLRNMPYGIVAAKQNIMIRIEIVKQKNEYFVGTVDDSGAIVSRESVEGWSDRMDALTCLLTGLYTQRND